MTSDLWCAFREAAFHTVTRPSTPPEAMYCPHGDHATTLMFWGSIGKVFSGPMAEEQVHYLILLSPSSSSSSPPHTLTSSPSHTHLLSLTPSPPPPHTLTSSPSHTHLLVVIISEGRHTLPWGTIIRLDLWPHWNGQHLQNRISVVVWGDRGQTDRRTCKQINRWWTDREERVMLHYLSILGVPGEVAEGLGQGDIVALLKEGKSFHTILQRETESKD